jgi:hypothetical protein
MKTSKFKVGDRVRLTEQAVRDCQRMFGLDAQWNRASLLDEYVVQKINFIGEGEHNTIDVLNTRGDETESIAECFLTKSVEKTYTVKTKFVFEGEFHVKAKSKAEAREFVQKQCGLVIGGDIHSTLPEDVVDWNFDVHPQKITR